MTKSNKTDYIIAFAVFIQPILVLLQHLLINIFFIPSEQTTSYRVILTAIPMVVAIVLSARRLPLLFASVYMITLIVFIFNLAIFPENGLYLTGESMRFFLPVVLPSALCLFSIKDIMVVEEVMLIASYIVASEVIVYALALYAGMFHFAYYNISFSYACLFPMLLLYCRKKTIPIVISVFLFLVVLAIGSRGASFFYVIYVTIDLMTNRKGNNILIGLLAVVFFLNWTALGDFYNSIGISSRTMELVDGDLGHTSGREKIISFFIGKLLDSPILGIGLFGDRTITEGFYCHNIILEIMLDFGIPLGSMLILILFIQFWRIFRKSSKTTRQKILMYLMAFVAPLMFSKSYLQSNDLFIFIGLLYLINKGVKDIPYYRNN